MSDSSSRRLPGRILAVMGWALAGGLTAAGAWIGGLVVARHALGWPTLLGVAAVGSEAGLALLFATCGFLTGAFGLLVLRPCRHGTALAWPLGMAATGALAGSLLPTLLTATQGLLSAEVGSGLAWLLSGMIAGLVGGLLKRGRAPSAIADHNTDRRTGGTLLCAVGWATASGLSSAAGWILGLVISRHRLGMVAVASLSKSGLLGAIVLAGGVAMVCGLVVGLCSGLKHRRSFPGVVMRAVGGATFGILLGALAPTLVFLTGRDWSAEVSSTLGVAIAGFIAGLGAYCWQIESRDRGDGGPINTDGPHITGIGSPR